MTANMVSDLYLQLMLLTTSPGLIYWGMVIHEFIDGYSWLITSLCASNNNHGETALDLFLSAAKMYGVPSHLRGDHGNFSSCLDGALLWQTAQVLYLGKV